MSTEILADSMQTPTDWVAAWSMLGPLGVACLLNIAAAWKNGRAVMVCCCLSVVKSLLQFEWNAVQCSVFYLFPAKLWRASRRSCHNWETAGSTSRPGSPPHQSSESLFESWTRWLRGSSQPAPRSSSFSSCKISCLKTLLNHISMGVEKESSATTTEEGNRCLRYPFVYQVPNMT